MKNVIVTNRLFRPAMLGIVVAIVMTSVFPIAFNSNSDNFNLVEIVENIELLELLVEEDHKPITFNYFNIPYIMHLKAYTTQIIGNTNTVSFIPDIPPELS